MVKWIRADFSPVIPICPQLNLCSLTRGQGKLVNRGCGWWVNLGRALGCCWTDSEGMSRGTRGKANTNTWSLWSLVWWTFRKAENASFCAFDISGSEVICLPQLVRQTDPTIFSHYCCLHSLHPCSLLAL